MWPVWDSEYAYLPQFESNGPFHDPKERDRYRLRQTLFKKYVDMSFFRQMWSHPMAVVKCRDYSEQADHHISQSINEINVLHEYCCMPMPNDPCSDFPGNWKERDCKLTCQSCHKSLGQLVHGAKSLVMLKYDIWTTVIFFLLLLFHMFSVRRCQALHVDCQSADGPW